MSRKSDRRVRQRLLRKVETYDAFEREIDDLLTWLSLSQGVTVRGSEFDGAFLFSETYVRTMEALSVDGAVCDAAMDVRCLPPGWRFSAAKQAEKEDRADTLYQVHQVEHLQAEVARRMQGLGVLPRTAKGVFARIRFGYIQRNGRLVAERRHAWQEKPGERWHIAPPVGVSAFNKTLDTNRGTSKWEEIGRGQGGAAFRYGWDFQGLIRALVGLDYAMRNWWIVSLRFVRGPAIRLLSNPVAVRELFALRDTPPDRDRREALRHWVRSHMRHIPAQDKEIETEVRRHLRGATRFTWNGLEASIEIPPEGVSP